MGFYFGKAEEMLNRKTINMSEQTEELPLLPKQFRQLKVVVFRSWIFRLKVSL